jgi:hypothetical protein
MWVALRSLFIAIVTLGAGLFAGSAEATRCDDIYPGGRIGPPPEWTFWGDGSACFVRWVPINRAHEEQLWERCRTTFGARFVHFEPNKGTGHSICIYKVAKIARAFADITAKARDELVQSERENTGQGGAHVNALTTPADNPETDNQAKPAEPAAAQVNGGDRNRLAATAVCSSTALGDYKHCVEPAQSVGRNQFAFSLKPGCTAGSIAAVSTLDEKGRCVRQVILLKGEASTIIQSYGGSRVIDAIAFQNGLYECYARRHDNVSCDGRTDYGALKPGDKQTVAKPLSSKPPRTSKSRPQIEAAAAALQKVSPRKPPRKQAKRKKSLPKQEAALSVPRTNPEDALKLKTSKSLRWPSSGVPFLTKPDSSQCFLAVHQCSPR